MTYFCRLSITAVSGVLYLELSIISLHTSVTSETWLWPVQHPFSGKTDRRSQYVSIRPRRYNALCLDRYIRVIYTVDRVENLKPVHNSLHYVHILV